MKTIIDWYQYLTDDFKQELSSYSNNDRIVVDCPSCKGTNVITLVSLKKRLKKLGNYFCRSCSSNTEKARVSFKSKYGDVNPRTLFNKNNKKSEKPKCK